MNLKGIMLYLFTITFSNSAFYSDYINYNGINYHQ